MMLTNLLLAPVLMTGGLTLDVSTTAQPGPTTAQPGPTTAQPAPTTAADLDSAEKSSLERALDTITADNLRSDLYFIASDAMKGRDSPSPQLKIAARYIRARLMRLGYQPGGQNESFFYEWTRGQQGLDKDRTSLHISGPDGMDLDLAWGTDYYLGSRAFGMREVTGGAIWGGKLDAKKLDSLNVKGKWVVGTVDRGSPRKRAETLQENGALGLILLAPKKAKKSVSETFGRQVAQYAKPRMTSKPQTTEKFPVVHLTERVGQAIVEALPRNLKSGKKIDLTITESCGYGQLEDIVLENVVGIWPGSDRKLKKEVIILSAHYDHVGYREDGTIFNGADDNGSGTTGLLAIAEALEAYGPMRRTVMLMWVSAEEKGLLGSAAWTKDPYLPGGLVPLCNINIDMIGRNASDEFLITPTKNHEAYSALTQVAEANMKKEGFRKIGSADAYWTRSDHANFSRHLGIPVAFLFCDVHEDYHKATDTVEKIDTTRCAASAASSCGCSRTCRSTSRSSDSG